MSLLLALLLTAVQAEELPIVVRARRTDEALARCLQKGCPTPEDARLSIALAEAQFAGGKYRDARVTLAKAIDRNRVYAKEAPRSVAALYEASGTINIHYGDMEAVRTAMVGQARTLRENLPADDPQVLLVGVQLADMWAQRRNGDQAERAYAAAQRGYAARGEDRMAALVLLRRVSLALARKSPDTASRLLDEAATMPAGADPIVVRMRAVLAARLATAQGDEGAVDRLVQTLRAEPSEAPVLLVQKPYEPSAREARAEERTRWLDAAATDERSSDAEPIRWVDVGFTVGRDGHVSDVEVLRGSRARDWAIPQLERIASRRYAPMTLPEGSPGVYRVERITYRAVRRVPIGSLIRRPTGAPQIETLDLTRDTAATTG